MADFHQAGAVATLHRLETAHVEAVEHEVARFAERRRIALVLPALFAEFSRPAIWDILKELEEVTYIDHLVLSLGKAGAKDLLVVKEALGRLPFNAHIIWNDGPGMQALYALLDERDLSPGPDGKGRSCWIAFGYALQAGCDVIAVHDCDITTYTREMLARLCYPVVHPDLGYEFAKAYYARVAGRLYGRVTRLLVTPLLRALQGTIGPLPLLNYLDSFRYALSGECAITADLARTTRLPSNWGLEIGTLVEVYRECGPRRVCQTEICTHYDHKHQGLSAADPQQGLLRMCVDVTGTLLDALAGEGVTFSDGLFKALLASYVRSARDTIDRYRADAAINGLRFDRHEEERLVQVFADGARLAFERYAQCPQNAPVMPSWARVLSAMPDFPALLHAAVDEDAAVQAAA